MEMICPNHPLAKPIRRSIARRIARRLSGLAKGDHNDPKTWLAVADRLQIGVATFCQSYAHSGLLLFEETYNRWVIHLNTVFSPYRQARILVHELAHWLLRQESSMLFACITDEPLSYCYDGPIRDVRHEIARRVEWLVVGTLMRESEWRKVI